MLRHAESAPSEDVGDPLNPDPFWRALLGLPAGPTVRPGLAYALESAPYL